jgi:hypothetical protein
MTGAKPLRLSHRDLLNSHEMTVAMTKSLLPRDFQ